MPAADKKKSWIAVSERAAVVRRSSRRSILDQGETTMKFLTFYHPEKLTPPTAKHIAAMGQLIEEMTKAGTLIETGAVPTTGFRVRRSGEKLTVTDGPFAESKEVIVGYALIEAKSKEHVIELTKRFLEIAGDGESDIRQVFTEPPKAVG
jgi:hypothetical protein